MADLQDFQYVKKDGSVGSLQAADKESALGSLSGLSDADPHSGIISAPPGLNGGTEPTVLSSGKGRSVVESKVNPVITEGKAAIDSAGATKYAVTSTDRDGNGVPDDLDDAEARARATAEKEFQNRQSVYRQLAVANTNEASAEISSIQQTWDQARQSQADANKLEEAVYGQAGFRSGQARYAPELQASTMHSVMSEGAAKLSAIDAKYRSAIAKANAASMTGNLRVALEASKDAEKYRSDALEEIQAQKKAALAFADKANAARTKLSRQAAIIGLMKQGVTDPRKLFDMLNYDDEGNQTGDVTLDEIHGVLGDAMPTAGSGGFRFSNDDVGKLLATGLSSRDIQGMQDDLNDGGADTVLAGLSGSQKAAVSKVLSGVTASGGIGGSLSISEARGLGLPLSLVGASQSTILSQLSSPTPPGWFREYVDGKAAKSHAPDELAGLWDQFRDTVNGNFVAGKTAGAASGKGSTAAKIQSLFPDDGT
jgi:hypothetical protein